MKIVLVDFEDSFTYNIGAELKNHLSSNIHILKWNQVKSWQLKDADIVCLGPGPGEPKIYQKAYPWIEDILKNRNIYTYGICLGHQIIGDLYGFKLKRCTEPLHGVSKQYQLPIKWNRLFQNTTSEIVVQHYNSLCLESQTKKNIETLAFDNEILMMKGDNFISYQFHPESIGTLNSEMFFQFKGCLNE